MTKERYAKPKVLHLTLKRKWFEMIASGEKTEEYRYIKSYWTTRLKDEFHSIKFRNGYNKDSPKMNIECYGITTGIGRAEWGAPSHPVYIIKLGRRII